MCKCDCYNTFFSLPFLQVHFIHPPSQIDPSLLSEFDSAAGAAYVTPLLGSCLKYINALPAKYISFLTTHVSCTCWCNDVVYYSILHPKKHYELHTGYRSPFSYSGYRDVLGCKHQLLITVRSGAWGEGGKSTGKPYPFETVDHAEGSRV